MTCHVIDLKKKQQFSTKDTNFGKTYVKTQRFSHIVKNAVTIPSKIIPHSQSLKVIFLRRSTWVRGNVSKLEKSFGKS